ncbi:hypothetical protein ABZW11_18680 [Nonomuraea sp. NPDC004580]|uniref:hypothetical protein n=1 Tax=Nonomuraea sp. NPDC004580 TaxID=3154552 RepID=UPI0033A1B367
MSFGEYVVSGWDTLSPAAAEHALVVAIALAIATAIGVGLLSCASPRARGSSTAVSATVLTILDQLGGLAEHALKPRGM